MSKIKKILLSACVTLLLASVLAVPGFALVSVDDVPYGYIQINSGAPIYCTGSLPLWMSSDSVALTSYALYIPFTDVGDGFDINLNVVSGPVSNYGTFSASYGTLSGTKYTQIATLPSPVRKAAPQSTIESGKYKIGSFLSVDCSGVSSVPDNCFIKVLCSGCSFTLYPSVQGNVGSLSSSYDTIYWSTALGFYINRSGMTSFSSTGSTSGSGLVKPTGDTHGYISIQNETSSPVRLHSKSRSVNGEVASGFTFAVSRSSDDSEAVTQLQKINGTLDGMAANLQTITDDFKAREDVGTDISGVTTDDQIANGNTGLTTGSSSISQAISGLPSFSSVVAPATGFISFLTSPVQDIFGFANGYLLYIATVIVLLSVIFWVIKRMGGDS